MMTQRLWLGFLLLSGSTSVGAQVQPRLQETKVSPRPLTALEGKAIVNAAKRRDQQGGGKPDCSHLVHEVYVAAGYPYPYASSFELYAGVGSFVRTWRPQAGDLVVWRGHVGIVVDPVEHSFYSSVRPGLRTDFYDAPAWTARGTARFYRYTVAKRSTLVLAENRATKISREPALANTVPPVQDSHENLPDSTYPVTKDPDSANSAVPNLESPSGHTTFEIPSSIPVVAAQEKPSQSEIAGAISELNSGIGEILREQDFSQLRRTVIIYDGLALDRPKFSGKHATVKGRIESRVRLAADRIEQMHGQESLQWVLLRTTDGWQVLASKDSICVPRDVAVRMLAARLASLTQEGSGSDGDSLRSQAQIVRVLSALFN